MRIVKLFMIMFLGLVISGCSNKKTSEQTDSTSSTKESTYENDLFYEPIETTDTESNKTASNQIEMIQTENGYFKVTLLEGWKKIDTKELSDNADLAFKNDSKDMFFMVFSESKEGFENFDAFKTSIDLSELGEVSSENINSIDYNGLKGERRTFTAKKDNLDIFYIYDLVEGIDYYLQCVSWTLDTNKSTNEEDLKNIMTSLIELKE